MRSPSGVLFLCLTCFGKENLMSQDQHEQDAPSAVSNRTMEMVVAAVTFVIGAMVIYDSLRIGAGWGDEGPKAGYFPFYIGALICIASLVNFVMGLRDKSGESFVSRPQARDVLKVLLPMFVYVFFVKFLGLYVASAIYIAFFMRWIGKYSWTKVAAVSLGVSIGFFLVFDVWFKVPIIKGPLEALLGLN